MIKFIIQQNKKSAIVPCKETKAQTSAVPLFLPEIRPLWLRCNGRSRVGLLLGSAACSKVIFARLSSPPLHQNRRLSAQENEGLLVLIHAIIHDKVILSATERFVKGRFAFPAGEKNLLAKRMGTCYAFCRNH
jgi:hypothetical protein